MNLTSGDISALIFKPVVREDLGNFSLDGHMLSLLMALDGKLTLGQVSHKTGLNMADLRDAAGKLFSRMYPEKLKQIRSPDFQQ